MKTTSARPGWLLPAGLLLFALVPVLAGAVRLGQLGTGAELPPEDARYAASPLPVVVHIVGVTVYCILAAFQFAPGFRRRRPGWHRVAGRLVIPCGLAAAVTGGVWMNFFYPHPPDVGWFLVVIRFVFGSAWILFLLFGFAAIRRRDIATHRAWMIRAYAVGMGAGTQVFTLLFWFLIAGEFNQLSNALALLAGWLINVVVAEWLIRRKPTRRAVVSAPLVLAMETR